VNCKKIIPSFFKFSIFFISIFPHKHQYLAHKIYFVDKSRELPYKGDGKIQDFARAVMHTPNPKHTGQLSNSNLSLLRYSPPYRALKPRPAASNYI